MYTKTCFPFFPPSPSSGKSSRIFPVYRFARVRIISNRIIQIWLELDWVGKFQDPWLNSKRVFTESPEWFSVLGPCRWNSAVPQRLISAARIIMVHYLAKWIIIINFRSTAKSKPATMHFAVVAVALWAYRALFG